MSDSDQTVVRYELDDHIATFTIDRPEARNAVNGAVAQQMEAALDEFEADPDAWVGIVTGTPPTFSAGADLKAIAAGRANEISTKRGGFAGFVHRERAKPMVAAVNGHALAGGCEIMLACDLAVASSEATFGLPEVKRSLVAAAGGLFRLPRAVGQRRAAEIILTGDPISADEALSWGLVNAVAEPDRVHDEAMQLARRITANAPLAVQASRQVLLRAFLDSDEELDAASGVAFSSLVGTDDFAEGPRAFIEKRPPNWTGR